MAATRPVADPGHDLALSTLTNGVAILDETGQRLTLLRGDKVETIQLTLSGPGAMSATTADRLAKAMFKGFPGESGITITVK